MRFAALVLVLLSWQVPVKPRPSCHVVNGHRVCDGATLPPGDDTTVQPVPVRRASWGRIKQVYR